MVYFRETSVNDWEMSGRLAAMSIREGRIVG